MKRRILVVDDDPGMLRAVKRILDERHETVCTSSPEEAPSLLRSHRPDLAILDIRMPELDGFELMARLKQVRPDLDVILMTGSADEADEKLLRSIRERAFYFIRKPFDREVLSTLVERCLELRRLTTENRQHLARLESVLRAARAFQSSLLPEQEASLGPVELAACYVPAEQLCGDFYDFESCGDDRVAFIVADVSGHGAAAAMLTGVVKSAFHASDRDRFEPAAVVRRIWSGIRPFSLNRFVSLVCGRIDPREGTLEYVNAGHPAPFLWQGRRLVRLESTGPIVSPVWDDPRWEQARTAFRGGDRILCFTDGVSEAQGPEGMFGEDVIPRVDPAAKGSGREQVDAIWRAVQEFSQGRRPEDDLTLLAVSSRPERSGEKP